MVEVVSYTQNQIGGYPKHFEGKFSTLFALFRHEECLL